MCIASSEDRGRIMVTPEVHVHLYSALFTHPDSYMDLQVVLGLNDLQSRFGK